MPTSSVMKKKGRNSTRRRPMVDTSQARSNIDVLRMCIRELNWNEVN
jgi:hypothetical protein